MAKAKIKTVAKKPTARIPTASSNPEDIYQQIARTPLNAPTPFDQPYQQALQRYQQAATTPFALPTALKTYLGGVSPAYTQGREAILQQFSDPKSALYISNPFTRLQAAQAAQQQQKQTYGDILQNVQNLVGLGVTQQQQRVEQLGGQLTAAQQAQKEARQALQQQFSNATELQRLALSRAAAARASGEGVEKPLTPAQVIALNNAGIQVKLGQKLSDLTGQQPEVTSKPTDFNTFVNQYSNIHRISPKDPQTLYQEYVQAQQDFNLAPDKNLWVQQARQQIPDLVPFLKVPNITPNPLNSLAQLVLQGQ